MDIQSFKTKIKNIVDSATPHGFRAFAWLVKDGQDVLKNFVINDTLRDNLTRLFDAEIHSCYLSDGVEIDSSRNIADNRSVLYEFTQSAEYRPFGIIENWQQVSDHYSKEDRNDLQGLLFRINLNDDDIWIYQRAYSMTLVARSKSLLAIFDKNSTYALLDCDILKIDSRIDVLIMENRFYTKKINMLQKHFGFEEYIRREAAETIKHIDALGIVSNTAKILEFGDKEALTNAKKLLKAKNSPVLAMKKQELLSKIQQHSRYKDQFIIQDGRIIINTQKDAANFIKMLNDDILRSELTGREYDSSTKNILAPLPTPQPNVDRSLVHSGG